MAKATAPATFSVPERRPRSCPPPCSTGSSGTRPRTMSAPVPLGAPTLCPASESASTPRASSESGSQPAACTASVCMSAPAACAMAASSAIGCTVPISLFASWMETSVVSAPDDAGERLGTHDSARVDVDLVDLEAVHAREVGGGLEHRLVLDRRDHEVPSAGVREREALDGEVVGLGAAAREDDVAGRHPMTAATSALAAASARAASSPSPCRLDGLPNAPER